MKQTINTVFKARVGSQLYGLSTPESDEDFCGVFMPSAEQLLGLQPLQEVSQSTKDSGNDRRNTKDDMDDKQYSLQKFLHLALQNNPNIVELLFVNPENKVVTTPLFESLIENRNKIISTRVYHTFSGYAHAQRHKLVTKRERFAGLKRGLDFMGDLFSTSELVDTKSKMDETQASQLNAVLKYYKGKDGNTQPFHGGMPVKVIHELLTREYEEYGWRVKTSTFETLGYDVKFGYHLIRLMVEGIRLLQTGELSFPLEGDSVTVLRSIRAGQVDYDQLMGLYEYYKKICDMAYDSSKVQRKTDRTWANDWLIKVTKNWLVTGTL